MKKMFLQALAICACLLFIGVGVLKAQGTINTVAGLNGTTSNANQGYSGDNGPAILAKMWNPSSIAIDANGNQYIADKGNNVIRKVTAAGIITTIAGSGKQGIQNTFNGNVRINGIDTYDPIKTNLNSPSSVALSPSGQYLYIADINYYVIRRLNLNNNTMQIIVGDYYLGTVFNGDNLTGVNTAISTQIRLAVNSNGDLYFADGNNRRIRKYDATLDKVTTVAGATNSTLTNNSNLGNNTAEGALAPDAKIDPGPISLCFDVNDNLYYGRYKVRKINNSDNKVYTIAGTGSNAASPASFSGSALNCSFSNVYDIVTADNKLYICDAEMIRVVELNTNTIKTFAGGGTSNANGVLPTSANLINAFPRGIGMGNCNNQLYIANQGLNNVRKVNMNLFGNIVHPVINKPQTSQKAIIPNTAVNITSPNNSPQQVIANGDYYWAPYGTDYTINPSCSKFPIIVKV